MTAVLLASTGPREIAAVGKTMLARCVGLAALTQGRTVRFSKLAAALTDLLKQ